ESAKDDIALFVTNNFLNVLFNKENLKVFEAQIAQTKLQLDLTQERIDAGMIPTGDILDIEATYAQQQQQIIAAKNNIIVTLISLAQALNLENPQDFDIVEPNVDDIPLYDIASNTPADLYQMALDFRNEIKLAEQNIQLAETDLKISKGAYYPTLNAFINYNTRYSNTDFFERSFKKQLYENDGVGYGVALNVPIFNGWAVRNNVRRNKINVERQRLQYEQTELDLRTNVYQAYNDALGSKATFDASLKTQQARKQAYDYAKERYDVGLMNAFDFSQSQTQFTTAQNEVVRSKYDYIFRVKLLELLFGVRPTELRL
ncbi:MAG: TolC family protein, partial [Flavobacteriaceae bacterium]|nr:TolC family protein [Flavobacteriaceae bacterium]